MDQTFDQADSEFVIDIAPCHSQVVSFVDLIAQPPGVGYKTAEEVCRRHTTLRLVSSPVTRTWNGATYPASLEDLHFGLPDTGYGSTAKSLIHFPEPFVEPSVAKSLGKHLQHVSRRGKQGLVHTSGTQILQVGNMQVGDLHVERQSALTQEADLELCGTVSGVS